MQESGENYLKAVFLLGERGKAVHLTDVAAYMNVTKPSASRAMKVLSEDGFLVHRAYKTIELTEKGRALAKDILNRYHYLTSFLHEVLEVEYDVAIRDACKIEHGISSQTLEKLISYLSQCRISDK
mgnify:CR=1 FL=1